MFSSFVHSSCTWTWLLLVVAFVDIVSANTEIINIVATVDDDVNFPQSSTWCVPVVQTKRSTAQVDNPTGLHSPLAQLNFSGESILHL